MQKKIFTTALVLALMLLTASSPCASQPVTLVAVGDSLTEGDGDDGSGGGYPARVLAMMQAAYPGSTLSNRAVSGQTAQDLINVQLPLAVSDLNAAPAGNRKIALVWIGSNDLFGLYQNNVNLCAEYFSHLSLLACEDTVIDESCVNVDEILSGIKATGASIYIALLDDQSKRPVITDVSLRNGVFPDITDEEVARMSAQIVNYNNKVKTLAAAHGATTVDFFNTTIFENSATLSSDGNHPNGAGYDAIARIWYQAIAGATTTTTVTTTTTTIPTSTTTTTLPAQASWFAADFGDKGLYLYDGTSFTGLVSWNADNMLGWKNRLVADFNDRGLWIYDGGTWSGLVGWDAESMTVWGDKLAADFGDQGLWVYDGSSWSGLSGWNAENMQEWKDSLLVDFGDQGLWIYDGSKWTGLLDLNAENLTVWNNKLVADFGGQGLWTYNGTTWTGLVGWNPDNMLNWENKLVADFGDQGLWIYNGNNWTGLVGWNAETIAVWGNRLLADFGDSGLWMYNGSAWTGLVGWNADNMTVWGDKLLADFGNSGLWIYNGSAWTGLVGWDTENMEPVGF